MVDPTLIFEGLIAKANAQQAKSIRVLHEVLEEHAQAEGCNYSIAEIARLSVSKGGPSASTIRNKTGLCFRQLIEAWAAKAGLSMKKPANLKLKSNSLPKDNELLHRIDDPALRAVFGMIIAERNRFRNELNSLKANTEFVIDRRPHKSTIHSEAREEGVQVFPSLKGVLNEMEVAALQAAVTDEFFVQQGWRVSLAGQVKHDGGELYKHGYVNALRKILKEIGSI
jgi:hypothetical protein